MTTNILEGLQSVFSGEIVGKLGQFLGEDPAKTKSALGSALPAILGGLVSKGSSSEGASEILGMITKGGFGEDTLKGLSGAFSGGEATKNLLNTGRELLSGIFGGKLSGVIDWICESGKIGKSTASSLLALAVPAVMGFLGREAKGANLDGAGLMNLLSGQAGFLKNLAPAGLGSVVGLPAGISGIARTVSEPVKKAAAAWKWVLPLFILGAALLYVFGRFGTPTVPTSVKEVKEAVTGTVEKVAVETGVVVERLGRMLPVTLPTGVELTVPEFGAEKRLIAFIEDEARPVDTTTWFTLDRLEFETGSANLKPSSMEQLRNIAQIMKAYPNVGLKIGGYTDSTGNPEANLKLSHTRARNTMNELIGLGVDPARLEAEGYGDKHPVADNSTEEGRQKNRRIDLKVTRK